jgi:hypothetical protein
MTTFKSNGITTLSYESKADHILAAVTIGKEGEIYYLLI